ncbi:hypothetical protein DFR42_1011113 [Undibacterium pigrum]|uniref:Uncharacterized protein n=1 Tax=Undibacterium pigrum TaxID=401470 RepID=A0A318JT18_9BURK|nr:hypothetical protein DFR42_1011113 [Undibacterium pigrum]
MVEVVRSSASRYSTEVPAVTNESIAIKNYIIIVL